MRKIRHLAAQKQGMMTATPLVPDYGVIIADTDGRVLLINSAAERLIRGGTRAADAASIATIRLIDTASGEPITDIAGIAPARDAVAAAADNVGLLDGSGHVIPDVSVTPLRDAAGARGGMALILHDESAFNEVVAQRDWLLLAMDIT
ncbi:MAG: hypothetical protein ACRET0_16070, partial [Steroidobacteraceae bacterium]